MHLSGFLKLFGFGLLSATLLHAGAPAGPGYLARLGPSSLRFRADVHGNAAVLLPPLRMSDDEETKEQPKPADSPDQRLATTPLAEGLLPADDGVHDLPSDLDLNPGEFPSTEPRKVEPPSGASVVAPQMLLRYFNHGTNDTTVITMPVEFTPPGAPVTRSSSATYLTP